MGQMREEEDQRWLRGEMGTVSLIAGQPTLSINRRRHAGLDGWDVQKNQKQP